MNVYLITAAPDYLPDALDELRRLDRAAASRSLPGGEIALVESSLDMGAMHEALSARPPIFLRHIVPAQHELALSGDAGDLAQMAERVEGMAELGALQSGDRFSVQARVVADGARPYSPFAIREALVPVVTACTGATEDVRAPEVVLSVLALPGKGYIGLSPVEFNLSDWAGGARRFARDEGQITRSEFKLLEALEWGGIGVNAVAQALDLGAAPGGWTRVLLEAGVAHVTAVDPADLDPRILRDRRVTPVRDHAQEWIEHALGRRRKFGLIVSDIRMDARDAARLMVEAAPLLERDGHAIVTLKLPPPGTPGLDPAAICRQALDELRSRYRTVRARMLFHNRNEVTVVASL